MSQFDEAQAMQESVQNRINNPDDDLFVISDLPANLPKPYSDWIDPQQSLPSDVTYIAGQAGIGRLLFLVILRFILPVLPIIAIVFLLVTIVTAKVNDLTGLLIAVWMLVSLGGALYLLVPYMIEGSRIMRVEIKKLLARSRGLSCYGLYLGPDALLAWLRKECLVIPRVLIASASIEAKAYRSTTFDVIKLNLDDSVEDGVETWLGSSIEFGTQSLEQSPRELVTTINKWLVDHK